MQLYLMGFAASASAACGNYVLDTSLSKLKASLKSCKLFTQNETADSRRLSPDSLATIEVSNARRTIVESVKYIPDRKEKAAVVVMRSALAEHDPGGYMAIWLTLAVSQVLGRNVTPQYALIFLVNWVAVQYQIEIGSGGQQVRALLVEEYLKVLSNSVFLAFDQKRGLVLPS